MFDDIVDIDNIVPKALCVDELQRTSIGHAVQSPPTPSQTHPVTNQKTVEEKQNSLSSKKVHL
jgi:hypothetical protein